METTGPGVIWRIVDGIAGGFAAIALSLGAAAAAEPGHAALLCLNPVSGARWELRVDYAGKTVDSLPAEISAREISWFDPKDGGYNSFDRASGDLVTALGSSTGGWLRHNRCRLEQRR